MEIGSLKTASTTMKSLLISPYQEIPVFAAAFPLHTRENEPGDITLARFPALIMAVLSAGQFRGVV